VVFKHALKNGLIPVLTVVGMTLGQLLGGAVITETVFSLPGIGQLVITAIKNRDYPMVQGVIMFIAMTYVCVNLLVDILYGWLDRESSMHRMAMAGSTETVPAQAGRRSDHARYYLRAVLRKQALEHRLHHHVSHGPDRCLRAHPLAL